MADDRELAEIWRNQYTGPLFRKYRGTEEVPEASIGYLARQSRLAVDFCQKMMAPLGLKHYAVNTPLNLPSGEIGVMHTNVIAGFGGTPIVTTRVELSRKRRKEEEERELPGLFVWSKEVEIDGETVLKGYCLEPNPAIRVDGALLGEEGTWRLFELSEVPEHTVGKMYYSLPTNGGVTTLVNKTPDEDEYSFRLYFDDGTTSQDVPYDENSQNEPTCYFKNGTLVIDYDYVSPQATQEGFAAHLDYDGNVIETNEDNLFWKRLELIDNSKKGEDSDNVQIYAPPDSVSSIVVDVASNFVRIRNEYAAFPITQTVTSTGYGREWSGAGSVSQHIEDWRYVESPIELGVYNYFWNWDDVYKIGDVWNEHFLRFPQNYPGANQYDELQAQGRANRSKVIDKKEYNDYRFGLFNSLGLAGYYTSYLNKTVYFYDTEGAFQNRQDSGTYRDYNGVMWNDELLTIKHGGLPFNEETQIIENHYLLLTCNCTLDHAAIIIEVIEKEDYNFEPKEYRYEIKYYGFYDGVISELTEIIGDTGYAFQYEEYSKVILTEDGYELPKFSGSLFFMALQRPKAKP